MKTALQTVDHISFGEGHGGPIGSKRGPPRALGSHIVYLLNPFIRCMYSTSHTTYVYNLVAAAGFLQTCFANVYIIV